MYLHNMKQFSYVPQEFLSWEAFFLYFPMINGKFFIWLSICVFVAGGIQDPKESFVCMSPK